MRHCGQRNKSIGYISAAAESCSSIQTVNSTKHISNAEIRSEFTLVVFRCRFDNTETKKENLISFPINDLDMDKYVAFPGKETRYNLCSVSNHHGTTKLGHYTAFCKNVGTNG